MKSIREQIIDRIARDQRSQGAIADAAGWTRGKLCDFLNDKREARTDKIDQLIEALGGAELRWRAKAGNCK